MENVFGFIFVGNINKKGDKMGQDIEIFAKKVKGFKSVYLAGGIQHRARPDGWRQMLTEFFEKYKIEIFNPVKDNANIFNPSVMGYKEDGTPYTLDELQTVDEAKEGLLLKQTEENDIHYMNKADLIIFYLDDSAGFGTYTEFRENYDTIKKPFIIVRTKAIKDLPHWIKWRRYDALIKENRAVEFKSLSDLKDYYKKYLKETPKEKE